MEYKHGSHSIYDLKYHVVFCTKYRYRILTGEVGQRTRTLIREICQANYVDIVSGSMSPDHVHLLLAIGYSTKHFSVQIGPVYQGEKR